MTRKVRLPRRPYVEFVKPFTELCDGAPEDEAHAVAAMIERTNVDLEQVLAACKDFKADFLRARAGLKANKRTKTVIRSRARAKKPPQIAWTTRIINGREFAVGRADDGRVGFGPNPENGNPLKVVESGLRNKLKSLGVPGPRTVEGNLREMIVRLLRR